MKFLLQTYENPHIRTSWMWPLPEKKPKSSFKIECSMWLVQRPGKGSLLVSEYAKPHTICKKYLQENKMLKSNVWASKNLSCLWQNQESFWKANWHQISKYTSYFWKKRDQDPNIHLRMGNFQLLKFPLLRQFLEVPAPLPSRLTEYQVIKSTFEKYLSQPQQKTQTPQCSAWHMEYTLKTTGWQMDSSNKDSKIYTANILRRILTKFTPLGT